MAKGQPTDEYTQILFYPEDSMDIWTCNNCGSTAESINDIIHYKTCQTGEAKYWEKVYEQEELDDLIRTDQDWGAK